MNLNKNEAVAVGTVVKDLEYSHETHGEKFYSLKISSTRMSGKEDIIPVVVSERILNTSRKYEGKLLGIRGQFRSFNQWDGEGKHLALFLFAREAELEEDSVYDLDEIKIDGYICKKPVYRETPLGRQIADVLIAVNRAYGRSDYLPCICWGRNARFAKHLDVGTRIIATGRIQSREYMKKISDTEFESRTAYEVSISSMEVFEDEKNEAESDETGELQVLS